MEPDIKQDEMRNRQLWYLNVEMWHLFPGNTDGAGELTCLRALGEQEVAGRDRGRPEDGEKGQTMLLSEKVGASGQPMGYNMGEQENRAN